MVVTPIRVVCMALLALLPGVARMSGAQVRPDSAALQAATDSAAARAVRDSLQTIRNALAQARIDSIAKVKAADTIKAPIAHFESSDIPELSTRLRFSKNDILSSGAINLADILDRVPEITTFRSRWMAGIHVAAFNSDFRRVRVFYDGVERDAVEARNGSVLDLNDIPIWTLDEIIIERVAGEVRVWLRSLNVRRTTPFTRVDIFTGDLNTNGFRGIFARRFDNGVTFQFIGQQLATQSGRVSAFATTAASSGVSDGEQKFVDTRLGWARGKLTIDVAGSGISRQRDQHTAREGFTNLPAFKGARREGYARVAYGDSSRGVWTQALVGVLRTRLEGIAGAIVDSTVSKDSVRAQTQQILAMGYRANWWHASFTDRARPVDGTLYHAPALRMGLERAGYRLMAYAEQRSLDSLRQIDLSGTALPMPWLSLVASHSRRTPDQSTEREASNATRAEAAMRFHRLWLGGGVIRQGPMDFLSPAILGAPSALLSSLTSTGLLTSVRGNVYKDVRLDVQAIRWSEAQYSRPRMSVRSELALISDWRSHFPKGEFSINARVTHELRNAVPFYWTTGTDVTPRVAESSQVVTGLLELRIQSATLFYQYRNMTGGRYEQIPGITMPPAVQMYGVRWEFWN